MFFDEAMARLDFFLSFRKCPIRNGLQRIRSISYTNAFRLYPELAKRIG
jgi:hypothetical protein